MYDVIVAGAGPGGASAAYYLGQAGCRVLVLEKEDLPRYKTCGGGVSIRTLEKYFPFSFDDVIESRAYSISYLLGQRAVQIPLPEPALVTVMRERFDAHILDRARAEVVTRAPVRKVTQTGGEVVVETQAGQAYTGRYLIGADGANSAVARAAGLRRSKVTAAAVEAEATAPPAVFDRFHANPAFIFGVARLGYAWIFPKADHLSVGAAILHPRPGEIQSAVRRVAERYGIPLDGVQVHGHPLPLHLRREPVAAGRVLLVGDAAGLVDPLSGEGIRMAIKSAHLAAQAILQDVPHRYPQWVEARIGRDLRRSLSLGMLFYRFPRLCHAFGEKNPFATQAFMDMLSDAADYPQILLRVFGTLPLFLITEASAALLRLAGLPDWGEQARKRVYWGY
jgi:geranylgeranyl reductase family protein